MWITNIRLQNVRSFEDETIELSKGINLLVGPNNGGKSTLAYAALLVQTGFSFGSNYLRLGTDKGTVGVYLKGEDVKEYFQINEITANLMVQIGVGGGSSLVYGKGSSSPAILIEQVEPKNFVYPYLSKRKVGGYNEDVRDQFARAITGNLQNLYAKIDKVSNPETPAYSSYVDACRRILGFTVTCSSSPNGKKACYIIDNFRNITLDNMGEGVASVLGLLVDLCVAENKLFVIEEPENDIHPKALKELLRLIIEKSKNNQFIITTHSNIVTRFLGAAPETKLFKVDMEFKKKVPTSKIEEIENNPEARQNLLSHLGYELIDLDLWEGWLFLEESSAEKIIREYLVPWFAPELRGKLRTFSARSLDEIESKFDDFNTLFSYLNLQPTYKNKAWVIIDSGDKEKGIIQKLKTAYAGKGWSEDHFQQFDKHDFESYYPEEFKDKAGEIFSITDRKEKRNKKKALLDEVEAWIRGNPERARTAFEMSAANVIDRLKSIEAQMN
jgi:predicted ATPase